MAGGRVLKGLERRRAAERNLFIYSTDADLSYTGRKKGLEVVL